MNPNGEWRRLHNEQLHNFCLSPNTVSVIRSRRLRWAGNVARMEEGRISFKILTDTPKELYEGLGVYGRTILELILNK